MLRLHGRIAVLVDSDEGDIGQGNSSTSDLQIMSQVNAWGLSVGSVMINAPSVKAAYVVKYDKLWVRFLGCG
jgi:hypothetical protein